MKKIFKKIGLFLLVALALYGAGRFVVVLYGSYAFVERQPYMVMQTQNAVTFKWQTPEEEIGALSYGLSEQNLDTHLKEETAAKKHSITLSNLTSCTRYFYSMSSNSLQIDNNERSFTTLCEDAEFQRVWVIGDSGKKGENQQQVYKSMLSYIDNNLSALDMWVLLGDNAYNSGTQKEHNEGFFDAYPELIKRFAPWAVIGNHDARRWAFYDIFDYPVDGENGGVMSSHESFYSVNNGNIHLIMLDSETVDRSKDSPMARWLEKDLQANTKPWVIVVFHTPPYTDGGHHSDSDYDSRGRMSDMRENFVPLFDAYGVDLVLSGHSHDYERSKLLVGHTGKTKTFDANIHQIQQSASCYTKPHERTKNSGTIYQVCGSSSKLDIAELNHPALPFSHQEMGSVILEITPTTLTSKFLTKDGTILDQYSIKKDNTSCMEYK